MRKPLDLLVARPNLAFGDLHLAELDVPDQHSVGFGDQDGLLLKSSGEVPLRPLFLQLRSLVIGTDPARGWCGPVGVSRCRPCGTHPFSRRGVYGTRWAVDVREKLALALSRPTGSGSFG